MIRKCGMQFAVNGSRRYFGYEKHDVLAPLADAIIDTYKTQIRCSSLLIEKHKQYSIEIKLKTPETVLTVASGLAEQERRVWIDDGVIASAKCATLYNLLTNSYMKDLFTSEGERTLRVCDDSIDVIGMV
jgi:hypothetical protein